jgi:hypothetical protein
MLNNDAIQTVAALPRLQPGANQNGPILAPDRGEFSMAITECQNLFVGLEHVYLLRDKLAKSGG